MKVLASVCIIAAFCIASSLQDTPHSPCNDGPLPLALRIDGCSSLPCNIYKGTDLIAQWDFAANADAKSLTPRVKVTFWGITIDYPYPEQDACKSLTNGRCPLAKSDKVTYNLKMPIDKSYPDVVLKIEFALVDENKNVQVCFKVDGQVTDK
ncbi:NPC intracellular cholesterol transporter 2 [Ooceraea biroi]|uniref:Epididymal secretory protein E1 n=1 Tax=Ooceraea biroi TaxID=2015173 RepID=A0A026W6F8_OOCBI|nr:NPC intracellular cholesterol transporter 2 [Ooceraea biroi]EZA51211.1 Epididymal secretory protein E1 [Ooceraea biroi]